MADFAEQRLNMIESQVRPSDVTDRRVIRAMQAVPREQFVPADRKPVAYMDNDVPVAPGRALIAPRVLALMLQAAEIDDGATVLDIGCMTGYSTAVISHIAKRVVGVEQDAALAKAAAASLAEAGLKNATVAVGSHASGSPGEGPYDAILMAASIPSAPRTLFDQLKDRGRLVTLVRDGPLCWVTVFSRSGMEFDGQRLFTAGGPAMPGFDRKPEFVL